MQRALLSKYQAFRRRLVPTLITLLIAAAVIRLLWFPGPYFSLSGIGPLVLIMIAVNLIIGPGLTALVYREGKPGLKLDLMAIAVVELVALGWACHAIYLRQPVYAVFAVDRFEVVAAAEIDRTQIADPKLRSRPGHEPRLVFAEVPTDQDKLNKLLDDVLHLGLPDIDRQPEFWRPYASGIVVVKSQSRPLTDLLQPGDSRSKRVKGWLRRNDASAGDYVYLPLRAKVRDAAMIVHADIGYPVGVLDVDPW
jgi:hypothetical protein